MMAPLAALILLWPAILLAEYTLVLKNGRRITVQAYREEGGMIKFYGLSGEVGIAKDQIQTILKAGAPESRGIVLPRVEESQAGSAEASRGEESRQEGAVKGAAPSREELSTPGERSDEERAKEEKEYQRRVKEITEQIKSARERYSTAGRGGSTPEEALLGNEGAIRARSDDLTSRLRDTQHNSACPDDARGIKLLSPSPFTGSPPIATEIPPCGPMENIPGVTSRTVDTPPPPYTEKEGELSKLRNRLNQLVKERERLIEEMRQKNFETGSLFLD